MLIHRTKETEFLPKTRFLFARCNFFSHEPMCLFKPSPMHPLFFATFLMFSLLTLPFAALCKADDKVLAAPIAPKPAYLIRQITFEGNAYLNRKQLAQRIGVEPGQPYDKGEILEGLDRIAAEYRENGYISVAIRPEVDVISIDQVRILVHIDEGVQARTGEITFDGYQLFTVTELRRELRLRKGAPFSHSALEQGVERILGLYSQQGYPKVEIHPTDFQLSSEDGTINFHLQISEGNLIRIGGVKLSGLKKTRADVVRRELPIQAGDVFNQQKIDQSFHRLVNLGYFYEVNPGVLEPGNRTRRNRL